MKTLLMLVLLLGSAFGQITVTGVNPPSPATVFTPVSPLIINDAAGNHWSITMDDFGILHNSATSSVPTTTYQLSSSSDQSSWTVGITTGGQLTTTKLTTFSPALPSTLTFLSTHGHSAVLFSAAGILTSTTPQ